VVKKISNKKNKKVAAVHIKTAKYLKSEDENSKWIKHGTLQVFVKLMVTFGMVGMIKELEIKQASYAIPVVGITLALMCGPAIGAYSGLALSKELENSGAIFFDFKRVKGRRISRKPPSHDAINDAIKKYYKVACLDKLDKRMIQKIKKRFKNFGKETAVDKHLIELLHGKYERKKKGYKSGKGEVVGHTVIVLYDVTYNMPITWIYTYGSVHESQLINDLMRKAGKILGKGTIQRVRYDKGFYGFRIFKQMIKDDIKVITPAKLYNPTSEKIDEVTKEINKIVSKKISELKECLKELPEGIEIEVESPKNKKKNKWTAIAGASTEIEIEDSKKRGKGKKKEKLKLRLIVVKKIYENSKTGKRKERVYGLLTTDRESDILTIIKEYSLRWRIENFFKDAEQGLFKAGIKKYPTTKFNGVRAHFYLMMFSFIFIQMLKLIPDGGFGKWSIMKLQDEFFNTPILARKINGKEILEIAHDCKYAFLLENLDDSLKKFIQIH
jgi:hypothetical protein